MHRVRLAVALLAAFASSAAADPTPERTFWPSPNEGLETPVIEQTAPPYAYWNVGDYAAAFPNGVSQSFVWPVGATKLVRMDFVLARNRDRRPGRLELFHLPEGEGNLGNRDLVFVDDVELVDRRETRLVSFFPQDVQLTAGQVYLIHFTVAGSGAAREGYAVLGTSLGGPSGYAGGSGYTDGLARAGDLWMRLYTEDPNGSPRPPPLDTFPTVPSPLDPPASVGETSRDVYVDLIQQLQDSVRANRVLSAPPTPYAGAAAALDAFLSLASGDCTAGNPRNSCAESAMEMLLNARAYRVQQCGAPLDPDPSMPELYDASCVGPNGIPPDGAALEPLVLAYLWIQGDPSPFVQDNLPLVREFILDTARRHFFDGLLLGGTWNIPVEAMAPFGGVATLFAGDPMAGDFADYATCLWDYFQHFAATEENSGQYNGLFFSGVLTYALLTGREAELWADPRFLDLVETYYQRISPLGAIPNYGDSGGFGQAWASYVYLFEAAASHLAGVDTQKSQKYKLLADRLWDYHSGHICQEPPGSSAEPIELALAWIAANENVSPVAPPALQEVLVAGQSGNGELVTAGAGTPVGQTFVASSAPVVRVDVHVANRGESSDGTLRIYRWLGDRATSVGQTPLFSARVDMAGTGDPTRKSFRPVVAADPGEVLYAELARPAAAFDAVADAAGYAGGDLYVGGVVDASRDLRFAAYALEGESSGLSTRVETRERLNAEVSNPMLPGRPECDAYVSEFDMVEPPGQGDPVYVPDKLTLRSSSAPDSLMAVFELVSEAGKGQPALGALSLLVDNGSVLLHDTPYPKGIFLGATKGTFRSFDQSLPLLRRYALGTYGEAGTTADVDLFRDHRSATVARISFSDQQGWRVDQERRLFFVKDRLLWVRDRYHFPDALMLSAGPVWHVADIAPTSAGQPGHWFDVYTQHMMFKQITMRNPRRFARLFLVPRAGYEIGAYQDPQYQRLACSVPPDTCGSVGNGCNSGPTRVIYQRFTGTVSAGQEQWFDTLLIPHGGTLADDAVEVLHEAGDGSVILRVDLDNGESWTLIDNPAGTTVSDSSGSVSTDADYLIARALAGQDDYLLAENATSVRVGSVDETFSEATSFESEAAYLAGGDQCTNAVASGLLDDQDEDQVLDVCDNCPTVPNPGQEDHDFDGLGTACDAECDDGADNDGDGFVDADDAACSLGSIEGPACDDGIDNDGDGLVDYGADPGCYLASSPQEDPQCDDGIDNDGDGKVDFGEDPECVGSWWSDESTPLCGLLGVELLPVFVWSAWRRRRRPIGRSSRMRP